MTPLQEFLVGRFIYFLQTNSLGRQSNVWVIENADGSIQITTTKPDKFLGGEEVPFDSTSNGRIFRPKVGEVIAYLQTFGLSVKEAEQVADEIGVHP